MSAGRDVSARLEWFDAVLRVPHRNELGIDARTIAVVAALNMHMNPAGVCWPSVRLIAARAKCSPNTVTDRIKRLEAAGFLKVRRRHRSENTYQGIIPPEYASGSSRDTDGDGRRSVSSDRPAVSSGDPSVSPHDASVSTGDPSVSPSAHQPGNPRRGEPGNLGALGAPPAGGALGTPARDEAWVLAVNADDDFYDSLIIAAGYEPDEYDNDDPWVDRTFDHFWEQQCRLFPDWVTANEHGELSVSLENIHPSDLNADDVRDVARWRNRAIRQAQRRARARADLEVGREEALVATPSVPATKLAAD